MTNAVDAYIFIIYAAIWACRNKINYMCGETDSNFNPKLNNLNNAVLGGVKKKTLVIYQRDKNRQNILYLDP